MGSTPKAVVLIVDDNPINLDMLIGILEDDFELMATTDGQRAIELARNHTPDLVLLDINMPGLSGYDVCFYIKKEVALADIPIVFITGSLREEDEIRGFQAGAVDYISKPINPEILRWRISNHIALKQARDRLTQLALIDSLTGLANRRFFDQVIETECLRLNRKTHGYLSLILIDIDHFKAFNDTFGHVAGDHCLKRVADAIRSVVQRTTDITARYGGEEFGCILPETPPEGAGRMAEAVRKSIRDLEIPHVEPRVGAVVTGSLGVVTLPAGRNFSPALVIATADTLLYSAKSQGRNRVSATVWSGP